MPALNLEDTYCMRIKGQRHFRCESLHAVIGTHECARRWQEARRRRDDRLVLCRQCPVGALHSQQACFSSAVARVNHAVLCLRCGRLATRLIKGELCPSCSNREAEWRRGTNGRGSKPIKYVPLRRWRVGVIEQDGREGWRMFVGQNFGEALARAVRAGCRLHEGQPGAIDWCADDGCFEYRDRLGQTLMHVEVDGALDFVPLASVGGVPAPVVMPPILATPDEAVELLPVWLDQAELSSIRGDWRQIDLVCRGCRSGLLYARRRGGALECRCSAACC